MNYIKKLKANYKYLRHMKIIKQKTNKYFNSYKKNKKPKLSFF